MALDPEDDRPAWRQAQRRAAVGSEHLRVRRSPRRKEEPAVVESLAVFRQPGEPTDQESRRLKATVRKNLADLMRWKNVTPEALAKETGAERRWVRRLVETGMSQIGGRSRDNLRSVAAFFRLESVTDLWKPDLVKRLGLSEPPPPTKVERWKRSRHWGSAEKLLDLLETGAYHSLRLLIDDLHALELRRSRKPQAEAAATSTLRSRLNRGKTSRTSP